MVIISTETDCDSAVPAVAMAMLARQPLQKTKQ
jgi:hypothetical protein